LNSKKFISKIIKLKKKKILRIKIICGQQLPKAPESKKGDIIDPYVELELVGAPADSTKV